MIKSKEFDNFIRDITSTTTMSESEARRRTYILLDKEKDSFILDLENMLDDGKPLGPLVKELITKYKHD